MRFAHYIKPNARTETPTNLIFVDTETRPDEVVGKRERHVLWFGWALHIRRRDNGKVEWEHEEWKRFARARDFWDFVESVMRPKTKTYIFAHNWNFDGSILFTTTELERRHFKSIQYINEKPPFILRVQKAKATLALIDTMNYFTTSLADLGESIGIAKLTMPTQDKTKQEWDEYCQRDVAVLKRAMLTYMDFIRTEDLGDFRPTLASQSFNAFRHRFMKHKIFIHTDEDICALERAAYFGGRVECFRLGEYREPLYYLDVNSLYPSVMAAEQYPINLRRRGHFLSLKELDKLLTKQAVIARVQLDTDEPCYPIRYRGRLTFPVGQFETTLASPELKYALSKNHITKVSRFAVYDTGDIFGGFVTTLYQARRAYSGGGNPAFAYLCKILLNSLYGKFGQSGKRWENGGITSDPNGTEWFEQETPESPIRKFRVRAGLQQELVHVGESSESFPAIAAHVTAFGRLLLWKLILKAGRGNVYYTDTDSLVCTQAGFDNLQDEIDPVELGKLKIESVNTSMVIWGAKDYRLDDIEKHKGIRKTATQLSIDTWEQARFFSWDWHLSQEQEGFIYIEQIRKTLHRDYRKGIPTESGIVLPITLGGVE